MKTLNFADRDAWLLARKGKITGSRLKDIVVKRGTGKKIGFYELIAERISISPDGELPMDRGTRLEDEAIARFSQETGKKVDTSLVLWSREDNEGISLSPDGVIGLTEAVEAKCLSSARHIEAYLTQQIPDEYKMQALQYFIVNDALATLYMLFYDPRIPCKEFFYLTVNRKEVADDVTEYLEYQRKTLAEVEEIVNKLTF